MFRLFTDRIQGMWVIVWGVAPWIWFLLTLQLSGAFQALGDAQSGVPGEAFWLQTTPGFTPEQAQAAFSNLRAADAVDAAMMTYAFDIVFIVLAAIGAGALIGFGLRRLDWRRGPMTLVLLAPLVFFLADIFETVTLAVALSAGLETVEPLMTAAGVATAIKFPALVISFMLAVVSVLAGVVAWAFKRADKTLGSHG